MEIVVLAVALALIYLFLQYRRNNAAGLSSSASAEKLPYSKKEYFFSAAERSFFEVLSLALVGKELHIFSKVRMSDLLFLPKGTEERQANRNRIQSKHVDFVICDKTKIKPLLVIELDDSSHNRPDRVERDRFVEQAYRDAGLPLLRFAVKQAYSQSEIETRITQALEANSAK